MVNTLELANGNFVTMAVAEVTAVPYFELYDKALDRANYMNQVLFTQIISSMHRKSIPNGMCKDGCDFKLRSGADFVASRLVNTLLYDVADKTAFVKLLVQLDRPILEVLKDNPTITPSVRLSNCIKIKFLRKALLVKSFGITKAEYEMILKHPNFLKGGSRDA